jgi:hypothetical protein
MDTTFFGLLKFGERRYMTDFRENGTMYMNTVEYFRNLEGMGDIGDTNEGLETFHQSDRVRLKVTGPDGRSFELNSKNGLTGEILTRINAVDSLNIFCMYAIKYCDKKPIVDERNFAFGDTYVCITNGESFIERLRVAAKKAKVDSTGRFVKYFARDCYHGYMGIYSKFDTYSYQNEYRFVLSPGFSMSYKLVLGNISDIAIIGRAEDINNHMEVIELPP